MKDNAAVGTEWSQTFPVVTSSGPLTVTFKNQIEERGSTKTVNSTEYKDVIKVKTTITATTALPITFTLTTDVYKFYAPKVGPITERTKVDLASGGADLYNYEEDKKLLSSILK